MIDEPNLPEDERDVSLARRIGAALQAGSVPEDDEEGSFYASLIALRKHAFESEEQPPADLSERLWGRIDTLTQDRTPRHDRPPARTERGRRWIWTTAAVAVFVAALATLLLMRTPRAELIASSDAEVVLHTLTDGSAITLRPHSKLYLVKESEEEERFRLEGEAFFSVNHRPERDFVVEAGDAFVQVLGTKFNLSTWGEHTAVYLSEGRVLFQNTSSGRSVVLAPGQWSSDADGHVLEPTSETPDEHLDWMLGEMQFERRPVRLLAAELEQHFAVRISVPESVRTETLSGRILLGSAQQSLEDLGAVIGGTFIRTDSTSYRFEPR